ncbi:sulfatase [Pontiella agarivorans]|uniref:Sulfatase n=1 Tax=Pontiella agarivorans TaxID=3038953 RepID=A0ABU5MZV1_9BACT|nr:sulfatase [Pontiella agarivorans]MDZ8119699.1 sulfatase [Pontiella agarivorans]
MKNLLLTTSISLAAICFSDQPNIVFIYADDMGWTGSSVEMIEGDAATRSDFYQTPNLEKLAAHGMVFSQAYSPGPMCTPSRAAVLTGKTPAELHITTPGGGRIDTSHQMLTPRTTTRLPEDLPTLGTVLKEQGYATALLGKWHIGRRDDAGMYGFDVHDGPTENASNGTDDDPKEIFSLTQRGIEFMEQNVKAGKPFYLQLSHYAVHIPIQSRPESIRKFEKAESGEVHTHASYAGMTWDLDDSLAEIFRAVEKLNITDNTYIVFMSDNGAPGNPRRPNNAPLNGGKGSVYEGGIRIPFIVAGPGFKTGYCAEPVSGTDLFATFAAWAGAEVESGESEDLTPLLTGNDAAFSRRTDLLFHYPHYGQGPAQKPQTAIISGDWKLLKDWESGACELFNLKTDIGEQTDLSAREPKRFAAMYETLKLRLAETEAQLPEQNPDYNPKEKKEWRRTSNRRN